MTNLDYEVISDFLDGDTFEPRALGEALADPAGRDLLIDFVVLRYAARAQADAPVMRPEPAARRSSGSRLLLAAAAVLVALAGGYEFGQRNGGLEPPRPPDPTRVIQVDWQRVNEETMK